MLTWTPTLPALLKLKREHARQEYNKKILTLLCIGGLGGFLSVSVLNQSVWFIPVIGIIVVSFFLFYIRSRKFIHSYLYTYSRIKYSGYYEDYSWKDSFIIGLFLIIGFLIFFLFFTLVLIQYALTHDLSQYRWLYEITRGL